MEKYVNKTDPLLKPLVAQKSIIQNEVDTASGILRNPKARAVLMEYAKCFSEEKLPGVLDAIQESAYRALAGASSATPEVYSRLPEEMKKFGSVYVKFGVLGLLEIDAWHAISRFVKNLQKADAQNPSVFMAFLTSEAAFDRCKRANIPGGWQRDSLLSFHACIGRLPTQDAYVIDFEKGVNTSRFFSFIDALGAQVAENPSAWKNTRLSAYLTALFYLASRGSNELNRFASREGMDSFSKGNWPEQRKLEEKRAPKEPRGGLFEDYGSAEDPYE